MLSLRLVIHDLTFRVVLFLSFFGVTFLEPLWFCASHSSVSVYVFQDWGIPELGGTTYLLRKDIQRVLKMFRDRFSQTGLGVPCSFFPSTPTTAACLVFVFKFDDSRPPSHCHTSRQQVFTWPCSRQKRRDHKDGKRKLFSQAYLLSFRNESISQPYIYWMSWALWLCMGGWKNEYLAFSASTLRGRQGKVDEEQLTEVSVTTNKFFFSFALFYSTEIIACQQSPQPRHRTLGNGLWQTHHQESWCYPSRMEEWDSELCHCFWKVISSCNCMVGTDLFKLLWSFPRKFPQNCATQGNEVEKMALASICFSPRPCEEGT